MRVTNDTSYRNLLRSLERISERMQTSQLQIASGKKLHKLSDDPSAISDVIRIQSQKNDTEQYLENIATGKARLSFADTTLQNVQNLVERIRSLALSSISDVEHTELQIEEISGLRDQMLSAANTTFNGQFIFAGSNVDEAPYYKDGTGPEPREVKYRGDSVNTEVQAGRDTTLQVQIPGSQVFSGASDIFDITFDLLTFMEKKVTKPTDPPPPYTATDKRSDINAQVTRLEQFSTALGIAQAKIGALMNVAQSLEQSHNQYKLEQTAARARLEEADLAVAMSDYTQAETALRAATAAGARISNISILDYIR